MIRWMLVGRAERFEERKPKIVAAFCEDAEVLRRVAAYIGDEFLGRAAGGIYTEVRQTLAQVTRERLLDFSVQLLHDGRGH